MPNKYLQAALFAVNTPLRVDPRSSWMSATQSLFPESSTAQMKGCPKGAFLGVCEEGQVKDVPSGEYTRFRENKLYAIRATALLRAGASAPTPSELWE
jgi:hypothetical protein